MINAFGLHHIFPIIGTETLSNGLNTVVERFVNWFQGNKTYSHPGNFHQKKKNLLWLKNGRKIFGIFRYFCRRRLLAVKFIISPSTRQWELWILSMLFGNFTELFQDFGCSDVWLFGCVGWLCQHEHRQDCTFELPCHIIKLQREQHLVQTYGHCSQRIPLNFCKPEDHLLDIHDCVLWNSKQLGEMVRSSVFFFVFSKQIKQVVNKYALVYLFRISHPLQSCVYFYLGPIVPKRRLEKFKQILPFGENGLFSWRCSLRWLRNMRHELRCVCLCVSVYIPSTSVCSLYLCRSTQIHLRDALICCVRLEIHLEMHRYGTDSGVCKHHPPSQFTLYLCRNAHTKGSIYIFCPYFIPTYFRCIYT